MASRNFKILSFVLLLAVFSPALSQDDEDFKPKGGAAGKPRGGGFLKDRLNNWRNSINETAFNLEILDIHNKLRASHSAPDLVLSETLCKEAKAEAQVKAAQWAAHGKFDTVSDPDRSYNDNVWATLSVSTTKVRPEKVMGAWLAEEKKHNYSINYFQDKSGHFSQIIWKSTDEIGIGFAVNRTIPDMSGFTGDITSEAAQKKLRGRKYIYIVVVRYTPPGNILDTDAFSENISPPSGGATWKK